MPLMEFTDIGILQVGSGYAQTLVNNFAALNTFWGSWVQAGSWLHTQLNHLAESTCFVNRPESLTETLKNYLWNRQGGLNVGAIQRAMVGGGAAPVYDGYCPTCDAGGHSTCPPSAKLDEREINGITVYGQTDSIDDVELPILEYVFDDVDLLSAKSLERILEIPSLAGSLAGDASSNLTRSATTNFSVHGFGPDLTPAGIPRLS